MFKRQHPVWFMDAFRETLCTMKSWEGKSGKTCRSAYAFLKLVFWKPLFGVLAADKHWYWVSQRLTGLRVRGIYKSDWMCRHMDVWIFDRCSLTSEPEPEVAPTSSTSWPLLLRKQRKIDVCSTKKWKWHTSQAVTRMHLYCMRRFCSWRL